MKALKVLIPKESDELETPQYLFDELNREFKFKVDLAANLINKKCAAYIYNIECPDTGINIYSGFFEDCICNGDYAFCNPPHSNQRQFIEFSIRNKLNTVFLLPARTDTKIFHELIYNNPNMEIRFIKGRLKFSDAKFNASFPSMIVVYKDKKHDKQD